MAIHHLRGIFGRYGRVKQAPTMSNSFFSARSSLAARSFSNETGPRTADLSSSSGTDKLIYLTLAGASIWLVHLFVYTPLKEMKALLHPSQAVVLQAEAKEEKAA